MYGGQILCGMAAFKAHCTFGFWHKGMEAVLADGHKAVNAMGAFGRITSLKDLPSDKVFLPYIKQAAKLNESEEPARPRMLAVYGTASNASLYTTCRNVTF